MGRRVTLMAVVCVAVALAALAVHAVAQGEAAEPGRCNTQVLTDGPTFWVYTIDTTTGRTWFLDRRLANEWVWADNGAAPNGPGPVGKYQLVAFANGKGAHIYVSDTTTGAVWLIDEENLHWLPPGAPVETGRGEAGEQPDIGHAAEPGRYSTQIASDRATFWLYTIDTTTGRTWFLDRLQDGTWEWTDNGAAPNGPGSVGRYRLVTFANDKGPYIYVSDTMTGTLWLIEEEDLQWVPRGAPVEPSRSEAAGRPSI